MTPSAGRAGRGWRCSSIALLIAGGRGRLPADPAGQGRSVPARRSETTSSTASTIVQNAASTFDDQHARARPASGTVIRQSPQPGVKEDQGSTVTLDVSSGPGNTVVPGVTNMPLAQAQQDARGPALQGRPRCRRPRTRSRRATSIRDRPGAGTSLPVTRGRGVRLLGQGQGERCPTSPGRPRPTRARRCLAQGSRVATTKQTSTTVPAGTVISQSPAGGTQQPPGHQGQARRRQAPTTATVPERHGRGRGHRREHADQRRVLGQEETKAVTNQTKDGIVLSQSPLGQLDREEGQRRDDRGRPVPADHDDDHQPTTTPTTTTTTTTTTTPTTG